MSSPNAASEQPPRASTAEQRPLMYTTVYDKISGQRVYLSDWDDTAAMRERTRMPDGPLYVGIYISESGEVIETPVTPCGGAGTKVPAYWRGDEGNPAREEVLEEQAAANSKAKPKTHETES